LDIKSFDPKIYFKITNVSLEPTLAFAQYLSEIQKPTWIRFVLVPNLSDNLESIEGLAQFVSSLGNVENVEVLPFHKMGEYKWQQLGYDYQLKDTPSPTPQQVQQVMDIFQRQGLNVQ
jgi:pyruvate formate lyase activating enzyme